MYSALKVPVVEYAPYYVFGYLSPLVLLFMGATGWKMFYKDGEAGPADPAADGAPDATTTDD